MLLVAPVQPRQSAHAETRDEQALTGIDSSTCRVDVPAITHVDYSARVQTVDRRPAPALSRLPSRLRRAHGCPVLVNTCFNVRGEPIVCTPEDAYRASWGRTWTCSLRRTAISTRNARAPRRAGGSKDRLGLLD